MPFKDPEKAKAYHKANMQKRRAEKQLGQLVKPQKQRKSRDLHAKAEAQAKRAASPVEPLLSTDGTPATYEEWLKKKAGVGSAMINIANRTLAAPGAELALDPTDAAKLFVEGTKLVESAFAASKQDEAEEFMDLSPLLAANSEAMDCMDRLLVLQDEFGRG